MVVFIVDPGSGSAAVGSLGMELATPCDVM